MTAFVLGATGFVGREVVRQLCVRGASPVAHVRPDSSKLAEWQKTFGDQGATVDTTPWDAPKLAARFKELFSRGSGQLYICIGTTRAKGTYEKVDYGLTALAVEAVKGSETRPRIVYLSSVGANPKASSAYLSWRGKAEEAVIQSGLPYAIARPSIITGERDESRIGESAAAVIGDGLLAVAGVLGGKKLRNKWRSTTPDVLASALIRIAEAPETDKIVDGSDLR